MGSQVMTPTNPQEKRKIEEIVNELCKYFDWDECSEQATEIKEILLQMRKEGHKGGSLDGFSSGQVVMRERCAKIADEKAEQEFDLAGRMGGQAVFQCQAAIDAANDVGEKIRALPLEERK